MIHVKTLLLVIGLFALTPLHVRAQEQARVEPAPQQGEAQAPKRGTVVMTPDGRVAVGAKMFIGLGETMTLFGSGSDVRGLGLPAIGENNKKQRVNQSLLLRTQQNHGIDLSDLHRISGGGGMGMYGGGMDMGMGMGEGGEMRGMQGMGGMMSGPRELNAFYYVVHPDHGFAFLPKQRKPPSVIRLRPPATLKVHVPKRYSPDDFVVLACWMNRYADPISHQPIRWPNYAMAGMMGGGMGGMGVMGVMGGMGGMEEYSGMNGGAAMPSDPTAVSDPMRSRFSDLRLRTMVTHWAVASLALTKESEFCNEATVVLPPGEVRVTLVPKVSADKHQDNAVELERLLYFGGPSEIKLIASDIAGHHPLVTILPSNAVSDIEFMGRPSGSGIPDWTEQENSVFLTLYEPDSLSSPVAISSDRTARCIAEGDRTRRSNEFLGRIAHRIGKERYLAIGVPQGQRFYVWSADDNELSELANSVKSCDFREQSSTLQPMSVRAIKSSEAAIWDKSHPPMILKSGLGNDPSRRAYMLTLSNPQFDQRPRFLIDMTKRFVFKPIDPGIDPFTAKELLNAEVGVIAEQDLPKPELDIMGMDMASMDSGGMPVETSQEVPSIAGVAEAESPRRQASDRIDVLRRRIHKLEQDLQRAKKLLDEITGG